MKTSPNRVFLIVIMGLMASFLGCSRTTVTDEGGKSLSLVSPADQTVTQGDSNKVLITITRENFSDKVEIDFDDLPSGVDIANDNRTVAANDNTVTVTLVADADAGIVENHLVKVTASGPGDLKVSEFFKLTVKAKN